MEICGKSFKSSWYTENAQLQYYFTEQKVIIIMSCGTYNDSWQ